MEETDIKLSVGFDQSKVDKSIDKMFTEWRQVEDAIKKTRKQIDQYEKKILEIQERMYERKITGKLTDEQEAQMNAQIDKLLNTEILFTRQLESLEPRAAAIKQAIEQAQLDPHGFAQANGLLETSNDEILKMQDELAETEQKMQDVRNELIEAHKRLRELNRKASGERRDTKVVSPETQTEIDKVNASIDSLNVKLDKLGTHADILRDRIDASEAATKGLRDKTEQAAGAAENAARSTRKIGDAADESKIKVGGIQKAFSKFFRKLKTMMMRAFVFSLIYKGFSQIKDAISGVFKKNEVLRKSIAQIKGNLLTAFMPIWQTIQPAIETLFKWLVKITSVLAQLVNRALGKSTKASADAAKAMYEQSKAAKDAQKSMAGFDTIQTLSDNSKSEDDNTIAPDFSVAEQANGGGSGIFDLDTGKLDSILQIVKDIGLGFAAWKIGKALGLNLWQIAGAVLTIKYGIKAVKDFIDIWNNGLDWEKFLDFEKVKALLTTGLGMLFGKNGLIIGLIMDGLSDLVIGIKELISGNMSDEVKLAIISGILKIGIALALAVGGWVPLVIAAIVAIIASIILNWDKLKDSVMNILKWLVNMFKNIIGLIVALFKGDLVTVFFRIVNLLISAINFVLSIITTIINAAIQAMNLIPGVDIGTLRWEIPELKIPRLAQGAVIPPNREFLAVLGDQKSGTNIETPLETMVAAFNKALDARGAFGSRELVFVVNGKEFARATYQDFEAEGSRRGTSITKKR